jgi:hypothetical protein
LVRFGKARLSTAIIKFPSGKYGLVGSVPVALTVEAKNSLSYPPARNSMSWATEQEVIEALLNIGITHFQRADCSYYA